MSKKYVPLIIALIITALTFYGHIEVSEIIQNTCAQLDEVREHTQQNEFNKAQEGIKKLLCDFDAKQHILELFIKRENISAVSVSLHGLSAYTHADNENDLLSEIDKAHEQLYMLKHMFVSIF